MTAKRIDPEREAWLLRQLESLTEMDELRRLHILEELLGPYFGFARGQFALKLSGYDLIDSDLDDLAHRVLKRLVDTIRNGNLRKPLTNAALDNIDWEVTDYQRRIAQTAAERLQDPEELASAREREAPRLTSLEEAEAFTARIAELGERERRILTERFYAGKPPAEIAEELGISRENVDTISSRALAKLRHSDSMADVRKRLGETD